MASISNLASSLSSLSFSSQVSQRPNTLSFTRANSSFPLPAKSARRASLSITATVAAPPAEDETIELKKYVKSRLPGGFAAQKIIGTGRRKCAIARVVLQEGTGKVIINYRDAKEYLQGNPLWLQYVKVPLVTLGYENSYDVFVKAHGGGLSGQAQAITLGVARALLKVSADHRSPLKKEGLLTRDARVVERKKVGLKKVKVSAHGTEPRILLLLHEVYRVVLATEHESFISGSQVKVKTSSYGRNTLVSVCLS
ncbi:Small ribosomal subunit protein uS9c [Cardamine amara subsp. amara]|uniref:Small ribosomal subunit protein uS9c n=1 Tax=Cardamine amara subsp. amara TaxID=228776 RepID=A0ABD1BCQ1_CARAN